MTLVYKERDQAKTLMKYHKLKKYFNNDVEFHMIEEVFSENNSKTNKCNNEIRQKTVIEAEKTSILKKTPKVSVILPVYNEEGHLCECLDSILQQTLKDIEIICVDDGSTDNSPFILSQYAKDPRVVVLWQKNSGASAARNYALQEARGEYVTFMDSDDYYYSLTALELMYVAAKKHNVKVCAGLRWSHNRQGKVTKNPLYRKECSSNPGGLRIRYVDYQHDYHYHSYIYERRCIIENNLKFPNVIKYQDPHFFIRLMYIVGEYLIYPAEMYCYRSTTKPIINWNETVICAVLEGITNTLDFSRNNGLALLHWVSAMRISYEYGDAILEFLKKGSWKIFLALISANESMSQSIIRSIQNDDIPVDRLAGVFFQVNERIQHVEGSYVLEPLRLFIPLLKSQQLHFDNTEIVSELEQFRSKVELLKSEINGIQESFSFKIGCLVTWLPRKLRGLIYCFKDHGIKYTIRAYILRKK